MQRLPLPSASFPLSNCHLLTSIDDIKLDIKYRSDLEREREGEREGDPIISCVLYPHPNEGSLYLVPFSFFISFHFLSTSVLSNECVSL